MQADVALRGSSDPLAEVSDLTGAKVRVFMTELAENTAQYRSLHSLTQQVEHQYHGRFLIELIQNAHDAFEPLFGDGENRIEILFDATDSPHGSLLVANDGRPFSPSNFERLSQLGQSDKDPETSIGNKGIGFRSVLEICDSPEIYSRAFAGSERFDGYCFAFRPSVVGSLVEPMLSLANSGRIPVWPITGKPLVDSWSAEMLDKFRNQVARKGSEWLVAEAGFLSPYLLPIPLTEPASARVADFEKRGFSTVVRLPLKAPSLRKRVSDRIDELDATTVLFLDKLSALYVGRGDRNNLTFRRHVTQPDDLGDGERVLVRVSEHVVHEYAVWRSKLRVESAAWKFRQAIAALPGRWPQVRDIVVSFAVRLSGRPETGRFSIYLPTHVPTGSAVHISAPFFGNMSRTAIDFDDHFNETLRDTAVDLVVRVVRERLAGKGEAEARAIVDCLAPLDENAEHVKWVELVVDAQNRAKASLDTELLALADKRWTSWNVAKLVPKLKSPRCLTEDRLRRHAAFDVFHRCLDSRHKQIRLWSSCCSKSGAAPTHDSLAETLALVAKELHAEGGDWNDFWQDTASLLPDGQRALARHEVLLGMDGALHSATNGKKIFFLPRAGTQDVSDISDEAETTDVPPTLRTMVAFLSDQIQTHRQSVRNSSAQTPTREYLGEQGYVSQFRIETIFSDVLAKAVPALPLELNTMDHEKCREVLVWALRLANNVVSRGNGGEMLFRQLSNMPVPCHGGWYAMKDASFGAGWHETRGDVLEAYLSGVKTEAASKARDRLLLPPTHPVWRDLMPAETALLERGGVFDGLRLKQIRSADWGSTFAASPDDFELPTNPPAELSSAMWAKWIEVAKKEGNLAHKSNHTYRIGQISVFPGMAEWESMSEELRQTLSELILDSLPHWHSALRQDISKVGGHSNRFTVTSPLCHFLMTSPWLATREQKIIVWSVPAQRWFVSADVLEGRARHFAHWRALPAAVARYICQRPALLTCMNVLGMPTFDPHSETASPQLLETLIAAVSSDDVADINVLLGQIRDAWRRFRPGTGRQALHTLPVRRREKSLSTLVPTRDAPAFVPDSAAYIAELEAFDFPVVAMQVADAQQLRPWFSEAYGDRVRFTSTLSLIPRVDGASWTGTRAVSMAQSELAWLLKPLLVLVAHNRGVHSTAFKARVKTLDACKVDWVPNLQVSVSHGNVALATIAAAALWDAQHQTLIVCESCKTQLEELSTPLSQALERDDLELPLRFLLRNVTSVDAFPDSVEAFLAPLRIISPEQTREVIEHLKGDVGHLSRLLATLIAVVANEAQAMELASADSEEELTAALIQCQISSLDIPTLLRCARDSQDMLYFGRTVSPAFGASASLARWNAVLDRAGQPRLINRQWVHQFQAVLEEAASLMKRVIAHAIRRGSGLRYTVMWQQYVDLVGGIDLSQTHWTVDFHDAMMPIARLARDWTQDDGIALAVRRARSVDDLGQGLAALNVPLEFDPDELSRENNALFEMVARQLDRIRMAYSMRHANESSDQEIEPLFDQYRQIMEERLASLAFVDCWSEDTIFGWLSAVADAVLPDFAGAVADSRNLDSLCCKLAMSPEELADVDARMSAFRADRMHKGRLIEVYDEPFENSEDNLSRLWDHLTEHLPEEDLEDVDLDVLDLSLTDVPPKRTSKHEIRTVSSRSHNRPSRAVDDLVGLAGEIHVFRQLRKKYGIAAVPASAWVSENSRHVFRQNLADDGKGCDFAFTVKGRQYRVEVKSTAGDDESFRLTSSEIRLAMELASPKHRRKEVFLIVHVKHALSCQPLAVVLPNPYDPRYAGKFKIEEADARVRYRSPQ